MKGNNQKWQVHAALLAVVSATFVVGTANAASNISATEQSALEQYRNISAAERLELANEAAAQASVKTRSATAAEREMMTVSPSDARRYLKQENLAKSSGTNLLGRELRAGNAVGRVVGTAFMTGRKVSLTADGKHLETCESGNHLHDAKTVELLAKSAREAKKGTGHE
jgi:prophage DNA circulation protein